MKKLLLILGWYTLINLVIRILTGAFVGWMSVATHESGYVAAQEFFSEYGLYISLFSLIVAVLGTAFSKLPYTGE